MKNPNPVPAMSFEAKANEHRDEAFLNSTVKDFYERLNHDFPDKITFCYHMDPDRPGVWKTTPSENGVKIGLNKSHDPAAVMMHELYHSEIFLLGYPVYWTPTCRNEDREDVTGLIRNLTNNMHHRRFYQKYLDAGFPVSAFLDPSDKQYIIDEISRICSLPTDNILSAFPTYLTLVSPPDEKEELDGLEILCEHLDVNTWCQLEVCGDTIDSWASGKDANPRKAVENILMALGLPRDSITISSEPEKDNTGYPATVRSSLNYYN